jgi:wobble nucleotide-excising tRNase
VIKRILKIQNVGLFQNIPTPLALGKVTAVYAENGRGKSTLATILRSSATNDGTLLASRQTIDKQSEPQAVDILWESGQHRKFENGAWTGASHVLKIFDATFVDQNVYSGSEVKAEHRQALLDFALGDDAVAAKREVDRLTEEIREVTASITAKNKELAAHAAPLSTEQFRSLEPVEDIPAKLAVLYSQLATARNSSTLLDKKAVTALNLPTVDLREFENILGLEYKIVEERAEQVVAEHLKKHVHSGIRPWVEQGLPYATDECPFCGQGLDGVDLVQAYKQAFSEEYTAAKQKVASLSGVVKGVLAAFEPSTHRAQLQVNEERCKAWLPDLKLILWISVEEQIGIAFRLAQGVMNSLVERKNASPLERLEADDDLRILRQYLESIVHSLIKYNTLVEDANRAIQGFQARLISSDVTAIADEIKRLELIEKRFKPEIVELVESLAVAEAAKEMLTTEKEAARQRAESLMASTLESYQSKINALLTTFGADFSIKEMKTSYVGGTPRSDFALSLRSMPVPLSSPGAPAFNTTLSEADKRTLAFAFFLARLDSDPALGDSIIVLDDPMSSMDLSRRHQSIRQACLLARRCAQLILLSHDPHFIRKFGNELVKPTGSTPPATAKINRGLGQYSEFGLLDIDQECASEYIRNHLLVQDFVKGTHRGNSRDVAKAIRPMLEGYLHRRFPGLIDTGKVFGEVIRSVGRDRASPLCHLVPLVPEYNDVNSYAGDFHHDTNPSAESTEVVDAELRTYAARALELIHKNG